MSSTRFRYLLPGVLIMFSILAMLGGIGRGPASAYAGGHALQKPRHIRFSFMNVNGFHISPS